MKDLTAGESFRILMKREKVKQVDIVNTLGIDKRTVSAQLKTFDENKGNINTLVEYAKSIGYKVEFNFVKIEEEGKKY